MSSTRMPSFVEKEQFNPQSLDVFWMKIGRTCEEHRSQGRGRSCVGVVLLFTILFLELFVDANMELQAVTGLQQRICEYPSLFGTHNSRRISGCTLATTLRRKSSLQCKFGRAAVVISCSRGGGGGGDGVEASGETKVKEVVSLKIGSPVVVTQAPPLLKTAEPMPMMRPNNGLINVGDAGRIIDRRPKNTWAVRFAVGAYLIDRKYFEPLEL